MRTIIEKKSANSGQLVWITRKKSPKSKSSCDITIGRTSYTPNGKSKPLDRISITFRNGADEIISNTGYTVFAISGNRLFFKESDDSAGYKMSVTYDKSGNKSTARIVFTPYNLIEVFNNFIGDYELCYDAVSSVYFIERENK